MGEAARNSGRGILPAVGVPLEGKLQLGEEDADAADVGRGVVTEELHRDHGLLPASGKRRSSSGGLGAMRGRSS